MIPEETVERVREAADIVQIVGEHVKLRRMGRNYRGPCPLHGGKNPNFSVSPDKGVYHCFTCHESGNVFTFLEKMLGVDYPTAIRMVADRVGIEVVETSRRRTEEKDAREPFWELNATAAQYFRTMLWEDDAGAGARAYLESRDLPRATADRFLLGYAPPGNATRAYLAQLGFAEDRMLEVGLLSRREEGGEAFSRFRDRLMIPIHDVGGHVVGFGGRLLAEREGAAKYLNSPETPVFAKRRLLFNLHNARGAIRRADRVFVVEGYFDVIRLVAAGIEEVVAPLGTALTDEQAKLLVRYSKNVFLLYDSDDAGQKATFRSGLELLALGAAVRVVSLPDGEDPDSFVRRHGRDRIEAQVNAAIDVFDRQVQILLSKGWFADLHRRRRAIDKLLPTIRRTADPLTRDIYVARLAEASGVDRELLLAEVAAADERQRARDRSAPPEGEPNATGGFSPPPEFYGGAPPGDEEAPRRGFRPRAGDRRKRFGRRDEDGWRSIDGAPRPPQGAGPERELLRVLLHERARVELVQERFGAELFHDPTLRAVFVALTEQPSDADLAEVASSLPESAVQLMDRLLAEPPPGDAALLYESSINQLAIRELDARIAEVERQMRGKDGDEWAQLLARKEALSKERRKLGARKFKVGPAARQTGHDTRTQ